MDAARVGEIGLAGRIIYFASSGCSRVGGGIGLGVRVKLYCFMGLCMSVEYDCVAWLSLMLIGCFAGQRLPTEV